MASWKALSGVPNFFPDTMLLMTDGSVLVHDCTSSLLGGVNWYRLTPDSNGKYDTAGATWTGPFPMANARQFWASGVLKDGRAFVIGGEKSTPPNTPLAEIFDPVTNTWSPLPKPSPQFDFIQGDACGCILSDGRVLLGAIFSNRTAIWNPADHTSNAWQEAGKAFNTLASTTKQGVCDEETWSLLPDGTVLTVDISATPIAEKYNPVTDTWIPADQAVPTLTTGLALPSLTNTTVNPPVTVNIGEIGPAILLPNGHLFFVGATGHTALYIPPASPALPGSWTTGPDLPPDTSGNNFNSPNGNIQTAIDAPAVLLPGGKVLLACGNTRLEFGSQFWSNPTLIHSYDPATNTITKLTSQPPSNGVDTWQARFLLLPTGQVLLTAEQSQVIDILTDPAIIGTPKPAWKPVITSFTPVMALSHHYKLSGTLINGLSQANCYGDDSQMGTNYPIAKFTNKTTSAVSYFRTFDFSSFAVASPNIHDALVEIPASAAPGDYTLQVIANGIASDPVNVKIVPAAPAIAVNLQDNLHFGTVCMGTAWLTMEVFNVGGADLIINSVSRFSGSADFNVLPNPVTPLTIAPGDHVDFTITFTPSTFGVAESAVIRINSNDPVTPDFDVTATGTGGTASLESVIVDSGNFGDVCLGSFADTEITLNNNGPCPLSILNIAAAPADFEVPSVLSYPLTIAAGASIDIPIRFRPTSLGAKAGVVRVFSNDPTSPKVIQVSGNAPAPRLVTLIADSGSFGDVCLNSFSDQPLTLINAGLCPLTVTGIASTAEFLVPSVHIFPFTIAPGTSIEIPIRFQPTAHGAQSGTITIFSNDPMSPSTVAVSGNVPWGKLAVTGSTYFGEVDCGIAQKTISICNVGDCPLNVTSVAFSRKRRHFKLINNPFPARLHPGSCLGVVIQYRASCDPECCELVIHSDDPDQPIKVLDVVAFTRCEKKCECRCEKKCDCRCEKRECDCGEEDSHEDR
jgi:ASPM-SPD-2-Hydin domain-containing protein/HYDIN/CFA65/VesB family protein/Kelch motif protein